MSTGSASRGTNGTPPSSPGDQPSSRASPSESDARSTLGMTSGSIHRPEIHSGYTASRGASSSPRLSVAARRRSTSGHGASGLTWSIVTGETPPQSSMPASSSRGKSSYERFGGACTCALAPSTRRAAAIVQRSSSSGGSGASAMRVPGFARKFWTITSCTCPWRSASSRIVRSASSRSARVSPMPMRMPVVNGTRSSPAAAIVARRAAGSLSGEPKCGRPRADSRSEVVSSIAPIDALTGRRARRSSRVSTPGFRCGSSPVSSSTAAAARWRY